MGGMSHPQKREGMLSGPSRLSIRLIKLSDARNSLRAVIDQVVEDADVAVIPRRDAPDAARWRPSHPGNPRRAGTRQACASSVK